MKRAVVLLLVIAAIITVELFFKVERGVPPRLENDLPVVVTSDVTDEADSASAEVFRVHALLVNFLTAIKEPYRPPLGDNIDVVRALSGGNRYGDVYLATNDPSINDRGEWVDWWGTPYHFHARAADVIDVRSAGPDRIIFTEDDVVYP